MSARIILVAGLNQAMAVDLLKVRHIVKIKLECMVPKKYLLPIHHILDRVIIFQSPLEKAILRLESRIIS